ncbi:MAG: hypothetical protein AB1486_24080 [Planctomycetota bacterium]
MRAHRKNQALLPAAFVAASLFALGCAPLVKYVGDRLLDLTDIIDLKAGAGPGALVKVEATDYVGAGLGAGVSTGYTELYGRRLDVVEGMGYAQLVALGYEGWFFHGQGATYVLGLRFPLDWAEIPLIDRFRCGAEVWAYVNKASLGLSVRALPARQSRNPSPRGRDAGNGLDAVYLAALSPGAADEEALRLAHAANAFLGNAFLGNAFLLLGPPGAFFGTGLFSAQVAGVAGRADRQEPPPWPMALAHSKRRQISCSETPPISYLVAWSRSLLENRSPQRRAWLEALEGRSRCI